MKMTYETSYELIDLTDGVATISADADLGAPEQTIDYQGVPVKLESMTGHAQMQQQLDLHRLIDHVSGSISMDMTMSAHGQTVDMSIDMGLQIVPDGEPLAPPPPAPASDDDPQQ
jgi:hypothetical protein